MCIRDSVMTVMGSTNHYVITLDRKNGGFAEVARRAAPGNFPMELMPRPGHDQALLMRIEFGVDDASHVHLMGPTDGGGYVSQGAVAAVAPPTIDVKMHPNGDLAYSPTDNPADPVTVNDLTTTGLLHLLTVGAQGVTAKGQVMIPVSYTHL